MPLIHNALCVYMYSPIRHGSVPAEGLFILDCKCSESFGRCKRVMKKRTSSLGWGGCFLTGCFGDMYIRLP